MRITGGRFAGRTIAVPGAGVRPTQDRVRAALFSMLAERVPGCRFLDLYAGSGAVGLEACSRGAAAVCWVEARPAVLRVLRRNAVALAGSDAGVVGGDVERFLRRAGWTAPFDLVYADPPYAGGRSADGAGDELDRVASALARGGCLAAGGTFVFERRSGGGASEPVSGWRLYDTRRYGDTELLFFMPDDAEERT